MWTQTTSIRDVIYDPNANFGVSLALEGDVLVVGADMHDRNPGQFDNTGAVYIFGRNEPNPDTWGYVTRFTAPIGSRNLGHAVAIDGSTIVAGARFSSYPDGSGGSISSVGNAFIYENAARAADTHSQRDPLAWSQTAVLTTGADVTSWLYFGSSVAVRGGEVLVGATGFNSNRGKVYQFSQSSGWAQSDSFVASDAAADDSFGAAVAIGAGEFALGAPSGNGLYIHPQETSAPTAVQVGAVQAGGGQMSALVLILPGLCAATSLYVRWRNHQARQ